MTQSQGTAVLAIVALWSTLAKKQYPERSQVATGFQFLVVVGLLFGVVSLATGDLADILGYLLDFAAIFGLMYWIGSWIYRDAKARGWNGFWWGGFGGTLNLFGAIAWLIVRPRKTVFAKQG
ncbi:MAG: hypothetical protein M1602_04285 [Firmicutes bacterium]|nr:hypothetical protein [Bacillota bacterium]